MRITRSLLGIFLCIGLATPAPALSAGGVDFPDAIQTAGADLRLQGVALLRYRVVFKAYAAALYLEEGSSPEAPLADVSRRLEIEYFWPIPAGGFVQATLDGIAANVGADRFEALRERIDRFNSFYTDIEPGDRYALTYVSGLGTVLEHNGRPRGAIEGDDFAAALFSIWLGEAPFDESLKQQLLGRP